MCGILGVISNEPVNQQIYDALLLLQHRGQDAAGIVTMDGTNCHSHKAAGMVREVFRTRTMRALKRTAGLGQVRYSTAGNAYDELEEPINLAERQRHDQALQLRGERGALGTPLRDRIAVG